MFEYIIRWKILKASGQQGKVMARLLKDQVKIEWLSIIMLEVFWILPLASITAVFMECERTAVDTVECIILLGVYVLFIFWFLRKFSEPIKIFKTLIATNLYSSLYTVKGEAIFQEDFDKIKKENKELYDYVMSTACRGYCYSICFNILQCLKKGSIKFIAIKSTGLNETDYNFEMHVLYVNGAWCFDVYSQKQYLVDELMQALKAKEYTSFSYSDVEETSYEEFRKNKYPALRKWCNENDCHEAWMKD